MISIMRRKQILQRTLSVIFAIVLWQLAAGLLDQRLLLASPIEVASRLGNLTAEPGFWRTIGFSLSRIVLGFFSGLILGTAAAFLSYRFKWVEILLWPYVTLVKTVPVASFIVISLVWLKAENLSIFISFLMVFPLVYFNILQGMRAVDIKQLQMLRLFRVPFTRRLRYVYFPQLKPFIFSACSAALGIAWKSGVAAEIIGIPTGSIGEQLYEAKAYLSTPDLFAWTIVIVVLSVAFEKLFLALLKMIFAKSEKQ